MSGDDQRGAVGVELPQSVILRVLDGNGRPVPHAVVSFTVSAGSGTVIPAQVATDAGGSATARWTLGKQAGNGQSLTASVPGGDLSHTFHATADAGPLSAIAQLTAVPQAIISGAPIPLLQIQLVDAFGNGVHQAGAQITASIDGRNLAGRTLSGTKTVTTDTSGIANFSDLVLRGMTTSWEGELALLKFSTAGIQSVTDSLTVTYGPPATLVVNPSSAVTVYAGAYLHVDAVVFDAWRNLLPNMHVDYTYPADDGSLTTVEMSDPGVLASIQGILPMPTTPGTYSITAKSPEVPNQEITFPVTVVRASALLILSGDSVSAPSGSVVTLVVRAVDASGNGVAGADVHWSIESGAGYLLGDWTAIETLSDATGQSSVPLNLGYPPGPVKVRASLGGTTASVVFTLTAT